MCTNLYCEDATGPAVTVTLEDVLYLQAALSSLLKHCLKIHYKFSQQGSLNTITDLKFLFYLF